MGIKKLTEGRKMFLSVMAIFIAYAFVFMLFDDYDRRNWTPLSDEWDWHMLGFSVLVMLGLGGVLLRYSRRMDERISRDQTKKNSQMRRELTQNISHELKTPVASILGYMETLLDNPEIDEATRTQFLQRTNAQALRLTALLQDISTLNRMDYASELYQFSEVDVVDIIEEIKQETALKLENRKMEIVCSLPANLVVHGNESLLYSVFRNLIDNALNYAGERSKITIDANDKGRYWDIMVADNGVGVADEHLSRLFERFYRVDKGRSRGMGGTGLGLAIVKNAILLHGGTVVGLKNESGGLCFKLTLPKGTLQSGPSK